MVLQVLNTSEFVNLITKKTVKCISSFTGSLGLPISIFQIMSTLINVINNVDSEIENLSWRKKFRFHNRKLLKFGIFEHKTSIVLAGETSHYFTLFAIARLSWKHIIWKMLNYQKSLQKNTIFWLNSVYFRNNSQK